jgi:PAS domain-containing protein
VLLLAAGSTALWLMHKLRTHLASTRQQLDASATRYRDLSETAQDGMWQTDAQARFCISTSACATCWACRRRPAGPKMSETTMKPPQRLCPLRRAAEQSCMGELRFPHGDGTERWVMLSGRRRTTARGRLTGALVLISDITEHKRAEHALASPMRSWKAASPCARPSCRT